MASRYYDLSHSRPNSTLKTAVTVVNFNEWAGEMVGE